MSVLRYAPTLFRALPLIAIACAPAAAWAQTGISEADVIQPEDEDEDLTVEPFSATERDALTTRPTVNITRPEIESELNRGEGEPASVFSEEGAVFFRLNAVSRVIARDNLDFRALDDDTVQGAIDSDDQLTFGANQLRAGFRFLPSEDTALDVSLAHNSLWGGGSITNLNNSNQFFIDNLYFSWIPEIRGPLDVIARVGRQYFEIGGAADILSQRRDYFFWDVIDGATLDIDFGDAGRLRTLLVDFSGTQFRPDEVDFARRQQTASSDLNFRGATLTYRTGAVYELLELVEGLEVRAFGFYADVGSGISPEAGTAADICYGGQLCNFVDNDYNWMAGTRTGYFFDPPETRTRVGGYLEYARSGGIDRKAQAVGLRDVKANGNAFGATFLADFDLDGLVFGGDLQYFRAEGASYTRFEGVEFNHGFVGFKGAHVGGPLIDDNAGWHPTAYVSGADGIESTAQDQQRRAGTESIHVGASATFADQLILQAGAWFLRDTGSGTEGDIEMLSRSAPFGYSEADFIAQQRLGKRLGTEYDLGASYQATESLAIFGQGAAFVPGDFYRGEIDRTGGTALGSDDPQTAWVLTGGVALEIR